MQCGSIRFKVCDRKQAAERPFQHQVIVRKTDIQLPDDLKEEKTQTAIHKIYALLIADQARNDLIVKDVLFAIRQKRSPVVITERKEHLNYLFSRLDGKVKNLIVLKGGIGKKALRSIIQRLKSIPENEERVLLATGKYLGEGFDDARLDTLFLTMPVSWKGTLSQYAGRLHRLHDRKTEVIIYDYADLKIPVTARMFQRRCKGYKAIGYEINDSNIHQPLLLSQ
jgi:superfamily II DNA or RNA helicase